MTKIAAVLLLSSLVLACARETRPPACVATSPSSASKNLVHRAWASHDGAVWAVGVGGAIERFDGAKWSHVDSGTKETLFGVYGFAADDVWAVGTSDTVLHFDGAKWTTTTTGLGHDLHAVWGTAHDDVWVVGCGGSVAHFDGKVWSGAETGIGDGLFAVHGTSAKDVWAVGMNGAALHFDGEAWSATRAGDRHLYDVLATESSVFAVGLSGALMQLDRARNVWSSTETNAGDLVAISGRAADDVWVVGWSDEALHFDGVRWTSRATGVSSGFQTLIARDGVAWGFANDRSIVRLDVR